MLLPLSQWKRNLGKDDSGNYNTNYNCQTKNGLQDSHKKNLNFTIFDWQKGFQQLNLTVIETRGFCDYKFWSIKMMPWSLTKSSVGLKQTVWCLAGARHRADIPSIENIFGLLRKHINYFLQKCYCLHLLFREQLQTISHPSFVSAYFQAERYSLWKGKSI